MMIMKTGDTCRDVAVTECSICESLWQIATGLVLAHVRMVAGMVTVISLSYIAQAVLARGNISGRGALW